MTEERRTGGGGPPQGLNVQRIVERHGQQPEMDNVHRQLRPDEQTAPDDSRPIDDWHQENGYLRMEPNPQPTTDQPGQDQPDQQLTTNQQFKERPQLLRLQSIWRTFQNKMSPDAEEFELQHRHRQDQHQDRQQQHLLPQQYGNEYTQQHGEQTQQQQQSPLQQQQQNDEQQQHVEQTQQQQQSPLQQQENDAQQQRYQNVQHLPSQSEIILKP